MRERPPAELSDGGYWYVLEAVPHPDDGEGLSPGEVPSGWCAWYREIDGTDYVVIRTPDPIEGVDNISDILPAAVLSDQVSRPRGRVGGR